MKKIQDPISSIPSTHAYQHLLPDPVPAGSWVTSYDIRPQCQLVSKLLPLNIFGHFHLLLSQFNIFCYHKKPIQPIYWLVLSHVSPSKFPVKKARPSFSTKTELKFPGTGTTSRAHRSKQGGAAALYRQRRVKKEERDKRREFGSIEMCMEGVF